MPNSESHSTSPPSSPGQHEIGSLIAAFEKTLPWPLDEFQIEAIQKLETHRGVLVSAPTSSGKTIVAEYPIWRALRAPSGLLDGLLDRVAPRRRVIYTTPLKALSNQKYHDLCVRYGEAQVGLVTGEHTLNDEAAVVVMTTEILRNVIYDEPARVDLVGDVILDEIHYINEFPRGTVWEEVIISAPQHMRMVGLSATISNVAEVADWMSGLRGPIATVVRTERPVALSLWLGMDNEFHALFDENGAIHRGTLDRAHNDELDDARLRYVRRAPDNDLLHVIARLGEAAMLPAIYFIFSRRGCREALARCALHGIDLTAPAEKKRIDQLWRERLDTIADDDERQVYRQSLDPASLTRGIAMHHAGMLPYAKETVEQLFIEGLIKVVFATETLSLGLNMPARACVVSSFTKFDGTGFHPLSSGELAQLMGRAGRRGIDTVGHGVILKEHDVDVRDVYEAAVGGEMTVRSKFAPTYTMVLNLLRNRSAAEAETLIEKSFGQYQDLRRSEHWVHRERNLRERLADITLQTFQHPTIACTEKTLSSYLNAVDEIERIETALRRARHEHWRDGRRGRYGGRTADPGQRQEAMRRSLVTLRGRVNGSPCRRCPYLGDHRGRRLEVAEITNTLASGEVELREAAQRYRREFRALRAVLRDGGFLEEDRPTDLGRLAASMYGDSALLLADAIVAGRFDDLEPAELAAALIMVVAEDRGRDRAGPSRHRFPTPHVEQVWRYLRNGLNRISALERHHGLDTLRPLSVDYIEAAYHWASGVPLGDIDAPAGGDLGDVVKAMKNLYAILRQMEISLRSVPVGGLVAATRERMERDLIRRV